LPILDANSELKLGSRRILLLEDRKTVEVFLAMT
jgi:hypothetical protein